MKLKDALVVLAMIIAFLILLNTPIFAKTVIVDVDSLRLREKASTDADVLKGLVRGDKLEYISEEGKWYKVKSGGITGYVSKDFTKLEEDEITTQAQTPAPETTDKEENKPEEQPAVAETSEMKISKDSDIYILPLINANTIQNIKAGNNVKILSKTNGWAYVETDELMGWIRQSSLTDSSVVSDDIDTTEKQEDTTDTNAKSEEKKTGDTEITAKTMYVNSPSVYIRKGPGTNYDTAGSLVLNDSVKVVAENEDWYKVDASGKTGYIAKRLLSDKQTNATTRSNDQREESQENQASTPVNTASSKGQQIVDFAMNYIGKKYVYGGSGPNTFDCSGFTMYVYKNFGVSLSHSATAQSKVGTYVSKDNLQPGDLVFFTDFDTGVGIGHVGIYIGNGEFIHASSGTGYCVKTSTLTSGSYLKRYETARRIF